MKEQLQEIREYYSEKIDAIDRIYFFSQDKERDKIDYKRRSIKHIELKELLEDFIEDIDKLLNHLTTPTP